MLWFHRKSATMDIDRSAFADDGAVEEIAGIKLHARRCRPDLKNASALWVSHAGVQGELVHGMIHYEVVIVAAAEFQLLVVIVDARADGGGLAEIKRCSFHRGNIAVGNERAIH